MKTYNFYDKQDAIKFLQVCPVDFAKKYCEDLITLSLCEDNIENQIKITELIGLIPTEAKYEFIHCLSELIIKKEKDLIELKKMLKILKL